METVNDDIYKGLVDIINEDLETGAMKLVIDHKLKIVSIEIDDYIQYARNWSKRLGNDKFHTKWLKELRETLGDDNQND